MIDALPLIDDNLEVTRSRISIEAVSTQRNLRQFIRLPYKIHRGHEKWIPPLIRDEKTYFDARKNPAFLNNDTILLLANKEGKLCGRIMGIINHRRNTRLSDKNACFGYLECYDDKEVAQKLLEAVEAWAKNKGMTKITGPLGFSDQDPEGYIIEGFDYEPTIATNYNYKFLPNFLEQSGYYKDVDYVVYLIDLSKPIPKVYQHIIERLHARKHFFFPSFTKKKELKTHIRPVFELMNICFNDFYGFDPLTEDEIERLGKQFIPILDTRFVKLGYQGDTLVGFLIGMPNLNEGFRKARGRLLPFGWVYLLRAYRKAKQFDLLIAGVHPDFRRSGLDAYGMAVIMEEARKAGYIVMDSHHELESNLLVRSVMERLGGKPCKRFRVYQKQLTNM